MTAVVCTYDRPAMMAGCIASLDRALLPSDQLVVVEAGDSATAAALAARRDVAPAVHLRAERPGKSRQLNSGVAAAEGQILLFTDDDVRVQPSCRAAMTAPFADPSVGAVCGRVAGLHYGPARPAGVGEDDAFEAPFETWTYAHGALMAVRADALHDAGGFDERLGPGTRAYGEEHDLLLRVRERGWKVMVAPAAAAEHLDWRDREARGRNQIVYERGAGAFVGAALRRSPRRGVPVLAARLRYQLWLVGEHPRLGLRGLQAFVGGLLYGARLRQRRWLDGAPGNGSCPE